MSELKRFVCFNFIYVQLLFLVSIPGSFAITTGCVKIDSSVELDEIKIDTKPVANIKASTSNWCLSGTQTVKGCVIVDGESLSSQGMAIYKDRLYNFFHNGYCMVHKLEDEGFELVSEFKMNVFGEGYHMGIVSIDQQNDDGAYLYTSSSMVKNQCIVLRLSDNGSEFVQVIRFTHKSNSHCSFQYCVGDGFLWEREISGDANRLTGDGEVILRKYPIPRHDTKTVILDSCLNEYVIKDVYNSDMTTIQGFKIYGGIMYALFGNSDSDRCLRVVDIEKEVVVYSVPLNDLTSEPEDCELNDNVFYIVQFPSSGLLIQTVTTSYI